MEKLCVFLVIAITANAALSMAATRHKRQTNQDDENNLDDRYGAERPGFQDQWQRPQRPQRPQQGQRPRPNQNQWNDQNQGQGGTDGDWGNQNEWEQNQQRPSPTPNTSTSNNGNGNQLDQSVQTCITACPVTSEYNPVCGSNMVQYTNPGRLLCAQGCGVNVSLLRSSPCPTTTTTPPPS